MALTNVHGCVATAGRDTQHSRSLQNLSPPPRSQTSLSPGTDLISVPIISPIPKCHEKCACTSEFIFYALCAEHNCSMDFFMLYFKYVPSEENL